MFKFIKIIGLLPIIVLLSCHGQPEFLVEDDTGEFGIMDLTDSLLHVADSQFVEIRNNKEKNLHFIDSLKHTIQTEEEIIKNLKSGLNRKLEVTTSMEDNLDVINEELTKALARCKMKEEILKKMKAKSTADSIKHEDEINHLHEVYSRKVRMLREEIDTNKVRMSELQGVISDLLTKKKKRKRKI